MIDPIGSETLEIMTRAKNYNQRLLNLVNPWLQGKIVEVGAGKGTFVGEFMTKGFDVSALDINLDYLKILHRQFPTLAIFKLDLQTSKITHTLRKRFDTVVMLNVLEHIKHDSQALKNIYQMLKPGGLLVLVVPAHQWAWGTLDKNLGHFRRYAKDHLEKILTAAGFEAQVLRHISPLPIFGWWFSAKVLKRPIIPVSQVQLFDPFVPVLAPIEDILNLPFGLSLFAVVKKP